MTRARRLLGRPALHFALLGALLFAAERWASFRLRWESPTVVTIPAARIAARERRLEREIGRPPTPGEREALVAAAIEEEILFREALARGLDRDDRSIRGHLAEKMRFLDPSAGGDAAELAARAVALGLDRDDAFIRRLLVEKMRLLAAREGEAAAPPDDATLAAFMAEDPERWQLPAHATVEHVFLRAEHAAEAEAILARLRAGAEPARLGDPFPGGRLVRDATPATLAKLLGEDIARHATTAPLGAWTGPVRSPWGVHLVRVTARTEATLPAVADVRGRLVQAWRAEHRRARAHAALDGLRRRWRVRVEDAAA